MSLRILIATTPRDLRLCRICLASVRRFHPDADIALLPGAPLPDAFLRETARHFETSRYPVEAGDYGWGFVKLGPLFGSPLRTLPNGPGRPPDWASSKQPKMRHMPRCDILFKFETFYYSRIPMGSQRRLARTAGHRAPI